MEEEVPLPEDILIELVIFLPIKPLIRFKCVSRYWCTLIKHPTFLTRHLNRDSKEILLVKRYLPPPNSMEVLQQGGDDILSFHDSDCPEILVSPDIVVPFLDDVYVRDQIDLFGPCNGLVCLVSPDVVVLSNPSLREFKLLAPSSFACPEYYMANNYGSGFGFDANTNAYKIIQMWRINEIAYDSYDHDSCIRIDLYNTGANSWSIIDIDVPRVHYAPGFDLYFNGACHWQANEFIHGPPAMGFILSFDVSNEVFRKFEFRWFDDGKYPGLVVLNQCIALVRYAEWVSELHLIDIWIMKEYGNSESWTKEFVIGPYLFKCPLLCSRNQWLFVETKDGQLALCAMHANEIKRFEFNGFGGSFRALNFRESLVSLN